jgi:hypothetical protein
MYVTPILEFVVIHICDILAPQNIHRPHHLMWEFDIVRALVMGREREGGEQECIRFRLLVQP